VHDHAAAVRTGGGDLGGLPALGQFLIVVALAGVGHSADLRAMARTGLRPVLLGGLGWAGLAILSLALQHLSGAA
jgi:uncharacterized membrane protein YadS